MTRRTLFLVGLLIQLVCVFGLFLPYVWLMQSGELVSLRTVPVDPRSIFRGDYVTLGYEAGQGITVPMESSETVQYVVLEKKGEFYERVAQSAGKPELEQGQVCLRGTYGWNGLTFPDIAQYFVPEGLGRELEQAQNAHRLVVDAYVNDDCQAVIRGVRLGAEAPEGVTDPWAMPEIEPIPTDASGAEIPVR